MVMPLENFEEADFGKYTVFSLRCDRQSFYEEMIDNFLGIRR